MSAPGVCMLACAPAPEAACAHGRRCIQAFVWTQPPGVGWAHCCLPPPGQPPGVQGCSRQAHRAHLQLSQQAPEVGGLGAAGQQAARVPHRSLQQQLQLVLQDLRRAAPGGGALWLATGMRVLHAVPATAGSHGGEPAGCALPQAHQRQPHIGAPRPQRSPQLPGLDHGPSRCTQGSATGWVAARAECAAQQEWPDRHAAVWALVDPAAPTPARPP
jgi:hypothetical protein